MPIHAIAADQVFDGTRLRERHAVVLRGDTVTDIVPRSLLDGLSVTDLGPGILSPGFVDLQVNGGGGTLFNDDPTPDGLARILDAHARLGTTSVLPTLISDTPAQTARAIDAVARALRAGQPGLLGLHLEGPHLASARRGAHKAEHLRALSQQDLQTYQSAATRLPVLKITLAPEVVPPATIAELADAGIVVSLGHSDADLATCDAAFAAGAGCVTHLFNAMSQLGSRAPGLVGAALACRSAHVGIIADGHHVHPASLALAVRAKTGPGQVFLVSDAMALTGSTAQEFDLFGRRVCRSAGRLTLEDGTLAGADLCMAQAMQVAVTQAGLAQDHALAMATAIPAEVIGMADRLGHLRPGARADLVHLDPGLNLRAVWQGGARLPI